MATQLSLSIVAITIVVVASLRAGKPVGGASI